MDDYDKFVADHWSQDLLDKPGALVAVIETKISRAVLHERRRIIDLLIEESVLSPDDEIDQYVIEKIREER